MYYLDMPHIHELYDFTVSAYILDPSKTKLLLHLHKKLKSWLQPGGHIELNEDPETALWKEIMEETGIQKSKLSYINQPDQPKPRGSKNTPIPFNFNIHPFADTDHKHIDLAYLMLASTIELDPAPGESTQLRWCDREEVRRLHTNGIMYDGTLDICNWIFDLSL